MAQRTYNSHRKRSDSRKSRASATRSATLKGRPSPHKGKKRQPPRAEQLQGLKPPAKPATPLKPWPSNCFHVVTRLHSELDVRRIINTLATAPCDDCHRILAFDASLPNRAKSDPRCERRDLRFLCFDCLATYDRKPTTR